jgi:hypothetical protein
MEEFDELFSTFDDAHAALFKFQSLFRVDDSSIEFLEHKTGPWTTADQVKEIKALLRRCRKTAYQKEGAMMCRRLLWFVPQKLMELNVFRRQARRDIQIWADMCIERTYEGHTKVQVYNGAAEVVMPVDPVVPELLTAEVEALKERMRNAMQCLGY